MPQIIAAGGQILIALVTGIGQLIYMVGSLALSIISTLVTGLITNAPQLMTQASTMFSDFCAQIQSRLPELITQGGQMILSLLLGLLNNAPQILEQAGNILTDFVDTILNMLPSILSSGAEMIASLLQGLVANAPSIIAQAASVIGEFVSTIISHLPQILQTGIEMIGKLAAGLIRALPSLIGQIPGMISDIVSGFLSFDWAGVGWDIISGIGSGIANAAGNLVDAAVDAAKDAVESVKSWLGIASPSKLMRDEVGKYMALGIGVGFQDNIPLNDMQRALDLNVSRMSMNYSPTPSYPTYPKSIYQNTNAERSDAVGMELLGNYIVNAMIEYGNRQGQALEKGISKMGLYVDGRQAGRFISDMGFVRR